MVLLFRESVVVIIPLSVKCLPEFPPTVLIAFQRRVIQISEQTGTHRSPSPLHKGFGSLGGSFP